MSRIADEFRVRVDRVESMSGKAKDAELKTLSIVNFFLSMFQHDLTVARNSRSQTSQSS